MEISRSSTNRLELSRHAHFIVHFLELKKLSSQHTKAAYERDIRDFFNVKDVETITLQDVIDVGMQDVEHWLLEMRGRGLQPSTINRKLSSLSSLYRWLLKYQDNRSGKTLLYFNPFSNLQEEKPRQQLNQAKFLTASECQTLLNSFDTKKICGLRNKALLSLALTTALRKSEMINLKVGDFSKEGGFDVAFVTRKGGKKDVVKIQPPVKALIDDYLTKTGRLESDTGYVFLGHSNNKKNGEKLNPSTLNHMLKAAVKNAGIEKNINVHSTRHTAITLAILGGASIEKVRDFAAHQSIATTNRYIHSIDRIKDNAGDVIKLDL